MPIRLTARGAGVTMPPQDKGDSAMADGQVPAPEDDDEGPFGRPLFDDPSARALSRVGVVDVGSNSVRMVVFLSLIHI